MKQIRKIIFWCHLFTGVTAGLVILLMSVTGSLLAFEPQIVRYAESDMRTVQPPTGEVHRLGAQTLLAKAREVKPNAKASAMTVQSDPSEAVLITLGREGILYLNPYTGDLMGEGSKRVRTFFLTVTDLHRWLGTNGDNRNTGRAITGACNLAFLFLASTGLYIWWPKKWTRQYLSSVIFFKSGLRGRARNFNWHNTIGFWSAPILILLTATGSIFSYQWTGNLLYTLTGSERPAPPPGQAGKGGQNENNRQRGASIDNFNNLDRLWSRAEEQSPGWKTINLRLPTDPNTPVSFFITESGTMNPFGRSQLNLNPATAEIVSWEPYSSFNLGRKLRSWVRSLHTGEAGGIVGQLIACLASLGGGFLVWTGLALALRRLQMWAANRDRLSLAPSEN
jgi:uncharacterized iron-regulated membrane protein